MRIIAVGDCHFPFVCQKTLKAVYKIVSDLNKEKPISHIVQLGDLFDMYSWSRWDSSRNIYTPRDELNMARDMALEFWATLRAKAPDAICYQIKGNHDERINSLVLRKAPELEHLISTERLFSFPGVLTQPSEREELILHDIVFHHGFRKFGDHVRHNLKNTVNGHLHRGGVHYMRHGQRVLWELNAGMIADPNAIPMSYTKQRRFAQYTQGIGVIDTLGPRFIPIMGGKTWKK